MSQSSQRMKEWRTTIVNKRIKEGYYGYCEICNKPNKEGENRRFCSLECNGVNKSSKFPERNRICKSCGKDFVTNPAYIKRRVNAGLFCSRNCWNDSRKDSAGFIDNAGYRCIHRKGRRIRYHRFVVEENIGRELSRDEHVHHIDGDKLNNSIENLHITTNSLHRFAHQSMEKIVYRLLKKGDVIFEDGVYKLRP